MPNHLTPLDFKYVSIFADRRAFPKIPQKKLQLIYLLSIDKTNHYNASTWSLAYLGFIICAIHWLTRSLDNVRFCNKLQIAKCKFFNNFSFKIWQTIKKILTCVCWKKDQKQNSHVLLFDDIDLLGAGQFVLEQGFHLEMNNYDM